ncbi:hypothetical protein [Flavobacterium ajazii]|uniref:hypothetical protein n=1 Tax=Flavobacterium ajazii TaxID=2692318 RepID=UPI0013D84590|nr:hypothetical protein [Flavobacterium ajazii]
MRKIFKFKEVIAIVLTIVSSILFFKPDKLQILSLNNDSLLVYSALLNIIILIIAIFLFSSISNDFYLLKRKHGKFKKPELEDLKKVSQILKISEKKSEYFVERTSAIVGQLVSNFTLFLWPLIIFYTLNIIKDILHLTPSDDFKNCSSYLDYIYGLSIDKTSNAFWYLTISALANIFNFISGIGLWVSFSILYQKTLDSNNKSTLHFGIYYFLLTFYILSYIILLGTKIDFLSIKLTVLTLDMFCSIFNCVAMILFFNRLVQILYFYQTNLKEKLLDKFYFFIATILFPIYACFQIFFGVFDQLVSNETNYYVAVKGIVFFVCFLGKLFLVLFLYSFIRIKWMHAAILTLIAHEETPNELAKNLSSISNSIDMINDEIKNLDQN